jgi:hypothetical protein
MTKTHENQVICGNGPTLPIFLDKIIALSNKSMVWGVNRIYTIKEIKVDYYIALDKHLWRFEWQNLLEIKPLKYFILNRYYELARERIHAHKLESFEYGNNPLEFSTTPGIVNHGYNSVFAAIQIAVMQGARKLEVFGVDFKNFDGKSHCYGQAHRNEKCWKYGRKSILEAIRFCKNNNIEITINSPVFEHDNSESQNSNNSESQEVELIKAAT